MKKSSKLFNKIDQCMIYPDKLESYKANEFWIEKQLI